MLARFRASIFTATPTVRLARLSQVGNIVTATVDFNGTLKAVTPTYIDATLPSGFLPLNDLQYNPAKILNNATFEAGAVRATLRAAIGITRAALWVAGLWPPARSKARRMGNAYRNLGRAAEEGGRA